MIAPPQGLPPGSSFHHIGVACRDLVAEAGDLRALGYSQAAEVFVDPLQGVSGMFLEGAGPRIELLAALEGSAVLDPWLVGRARMYHLAYEVDALEEAAEAIEGCGARMLGPPVPAVAFEGRRICFLMLRNVFLTELIEAGSALR